jgi:hypothetical protein
MICSTAIPQLFSMFLRLLNLRILLSATGHDMPDVIWAIFYALCWSIMICSVSRTFNCRDSKLTSLQHRMSILEGPTLHLACSPPAHKRAFRPHQKFSHADDEQLRFLVDAHGTKDWSAIADEMDGRTARQCKERWQNYLSPSLNTGPWTCAEDKLLIEKVQAFGSKWVRISKFFENRTDSFLKNRYNRLQHRQGKRRPRAEKAKQERKAPPDDAEAGAPSPTPEDPTSVDFSGEIEDAFAVATWGEMDAFGCGFGGGVDDWPTFHSGF